jgi:hypothetical protein
MKLKWAFACATAGLGFPRRSLGEAGPGRAWASAKRTVAAATVAHLTVNCPGLRGGVLLTGFADPL